MLAVAAEARAAQEATAPGEAGDQRRIALRLRRAGRLRFRLTLTPGRGLHRQPASSADSTSGVAQAAARATLVRRPGWPVAPASSEVAAAAEGEVLARRTALLTVALVAQTSLMQPVGALPVEHPVVLAAPTEQLLAPLTVARAQAEEPREQAARVAPEGRGDVAVAEAGAELPVTTLPPRREVQVAMAATAM